MPWQWSGVGAKAGTTAAGGATNAGSDGAATMDAASQGVGGGIGTPAEAAIGASYPNYNLGYLAKRLNLPNAAKAEGTHARPDKYAPINDQDEPAPAAQFAYAQAAAENYKAEADEQLLREFICWLQGQHEDNVAPRVYENLPGQPLRRHVFGGTDPAGGTDDVLEKRVPGQPLQGWTPTWWGTKQLTHLPGVREFLEERTKSSDAASYQMNVMAELGPQNLQEAWMYFKHWVKARPVTEMYNFMPYCAENVGDHGGIGPQMAEAPHRDPTEDDRHNSQWNRHDKIIKDTHRQYFINAVAQGSEKSKRQVIEDRMRSQQTRMLELQEQQLQTQQQQLQTQQFTLQNQTANMRREESQRRNETNTATNTASELEAAVDRAEAFLQPQDDERRRVSFASTPSGYSPFRPSPAPTMSSAASTMSTTRTESSPGFDSPRPVEMGRD